MGVVKIIFRYWGVCCPLESKLSKVSGGLKRLDPVRDSNVQTLHIG